MDTLIILGRIIGAYNDWDGDIDYMVFYDFNPINGLAIPAHDHLNVSYANGIFEQCDAQGNRIWMADIIETIKDLPKNIKD